MARSLITMRGVVNQKAGGGAGAGGSNQEAVTRRQVLIPPMQSTGFKTGRLVAASCSCPCLLALSFQLLDLFSEDGNDFKQIADDAIVGDVEDWCFRIFVDCDDGAGIFHADQMLNGAGDPRRNIKFRRHGWPRRSVLPTVRQPF